MKMTREKILIIGGVLVVIVGGAYAFHHLYSAPATTVSALTTSATTPEIPAVATSVTIPTVVPGSYLNLVPQDCQDTDVSDEYVCILNYASTTTAEADTLARKLISEAPKRLQQLSSIPNSPVPFVYGGSDFLKDLPVAVQRAQQTKESYIDALCNLDAMNIYGGSGMDLEVEACKYYNEMRYLGMLQSLEAGLTATST